ncbi:hypothetical protein B0T18DRAFT_182573 [Schizothecium vesticola]|uniref:Uncharacterized protein n=1 Tax=Schizothecium vesticola TaxID=314040 RepID=A0AA40EPZ6_9PEZI|nr:hypothetical protein B0T18DRAFT_182573 [Schizothecium vesticola]
MVWLGWGRPCADRLPRRHPASALGSRLCRGRFQNIERRHLGSINRVGESVDMMAMRNGRCPLPRQPHSPSRKADITDTSWLRSPRRTRGSKFPRHINLALPSQPRTCMPAAALQPSRLVPAGKGLADAVLTGIAIRQVCVRSRRARTCVKATFPSMGGNVETLPPSNRTSVTAHNHCKIVGHLRRCSGLALVGRCPPPPPPPRARSEPLERGMSP